MNRLWLLVPLLALAIRVANGRHGLADEALPVRLRVEPAALELLGPDCRHGVLVTAEYADGRTVDVTRLAELQAEPAGTVQIGHSDVNNAGQVRGLNDGQATLTARFGGQQAAIPVFVRQAGQGAAAPSFVHAIEPLLTRLGCNQGACHGKGTGQNGFRLSLRGYAPDWDHEWMTRELAGRRISHTRPTDSLLLRKPLNVAPHAGGRLISAGSREYQMLLDWIIAGAPGVIADEPLLESLAILPGSRVLRVNDEQQLLVQAKFADGRTQDVTWLAKFASNDPGVAEVSDQGLIRGLRHGETAIRVHFQGLVSVLIVTLPFEEPVDPSQLAARNNVVDEHVFAKLGALRIPPSSASSDDVFLRRACLDTIGRLPSLDEYRAFMADARPDKRARLVDGLLERPEWVDYWALRLGDLFQNRRERDHDVRGSKGVRAFHQWLRQQLADGRHWDQIARDVLTASGKTTDNPAVGYFVVTVGEQGQAENSEVTASVAQALLGTRIGCAQCHNHPLEKYTQDDFYHFAAFFAPVKFQRQEPHKGPTTLLMAPTEANRPLGVTQPRTGKLMVPQPLDRSSVTIAEGQDPRVPLAAWMTDPANEYFSGAMVNRLVRHFLGTGLVEPVDDLRASNPPSNPALWQALNQEFVGSQYNLKHLMRLLLNSRAYQLSAETLPANETDTRFYSHYYARRLEAETLLDAVCDATGVPEPFAGYPLGTRAQQLADPSLDSYFLSLFGRSNRVTACACERVGEVNLSQLLHLQNGETTQRKIESGEGRLATLLAACPDNNAAVQELFAVVLSRVPNEPEQAAIDSALREGESREAVFRDLFWALLNSKEFAFNH
ncbi:MAG: DUF1549 domain-containing protein [Pirellulales bacterium]